MHARPHAQRAKAAGKDVLVIVGVVIVAVVLLIVVVAGAQGAQRRPQRPQIKAAANGAVIGVILQQTIANLRFLLIDPYAAEAAGQRGADAIDQAPGAIGGRHVLQVDLNRLGHRQADAALADGVAVKRIPRQRPIQRVQIAGSRSAKQIRVLCRAVALSLAAPVVHAQHPAPKLPGQRRIGAAIGAEQFIHSLHAFIHHFAVDHDLHLDVINAVGQAAGVHFMVAHREVLHAEQPPIARQMHLAGRGEKNHDRRQRLGIIEYRRVGAVAVGQTINLARVDGGDRPQRLQIPAVQHAGGETAAGEITLVHCFVQRGVFIAAANTVDGTVQLHVVFTQRGNAVER